MRLAAIIHVHGNSSGCGRGCSAVVANHVLVVIVDLCLLWWWRVGSNWQLVARWGWKAVVVLLVVMMMVF